MTSFGAYVPQGRKLDLVAFATDEEKFHALCSVARQAETLQFDSIWFYDHLHAMKPASLPGAPPVHEVTFECWSLLAAMAMLTQRIRLGSMVTCTSYRSPALLAKMAATVDVMSAGRLNLGLGAGWHESEYQAYGYPFPSRAERLDQLYEAVQIIKEMWTADYADFNGNHFRIHRAINEPKPLQKPHPPIWIGGGGEKVTLRIAARVANGVNFSGSLHDVARKCAVLREHCDAVGRNYNEITKSINFEPVIVRPTQRETLAVAQKALPDRYSSVEEWARTALIGTPDQSIERIKAYEELGIQYFVCYFLGAAEDQSGMSLFAEAVMRAFEE